MKPKRIALHLVLVSLAAALVLSACGGGRGGPRGPGGGPGMGRFGGDAPQPVHWQKRMDADEDGLVSRQEFTTDAIRRFSMRDVDQDGSLGGVEVLPATMPRPEEVRTPPPRPGSPEESGPPQVLPPDPADVSLMPRDGPISRAAYDRWVVARFDEIDANRDESISREEADRFTPPFRPPEP